MTRGGRIPSPVASPGSLPEFDPRPLLEAVHGQLLDLLRELPAEAWHLPTVARPWCVKDIAAHLLDGALRRLSLQRDKWMMPNPSGPVDGFEDLVGFLNKLNRTWVEAAQRLSPAVLIEGLERSGASLMEFLRPLDLEGPAPFAVAWAGETSSTLRFDLARELTEIWLHQQQIRLATGNPPLFEARLLHPVMDTFMRALPHAYREVEAPEGASVQVGLTGDSPRSYLLVRGSGEWRLGLGEAEGARVSVRLDPETAWRLFSKGLTPEEARARVVISGETRLALPLLGMVAVMA
jgi:uncharacterized protein (TIGR03083 family)